MTVKGKVKNNSQDKEVDVSFTKNIRINYYENEELYYNSYLKNTSDKGYVLRFLGRNGEPYAGYNFSFNLTSKSISSNVNHILRTDKNGEIQLGKLENISTFTVSP